MKELGRNGVYGLALLLLLLVRFPFFFRFSPLFFFLAGFFSFFEALGVFFFLLGFASVLLFVFSCFLLV